MKTNQSTNSEKSVIGFAGPVLATIAGKTSITIATILSLVMMSGLCLAQGTGGGNTAYVTLVHPDGTREFYSLSSTPTPCPSPSATPSPCSSPAGTADEYLRGAVLQRAKCDAASGDTIMVGPGTARTNNLLKNGVNWHFVTGATIINECCDVDSGCNGLAGIFDDTSNGANAPVNCIISGEGKFDGGTGGTSAVVYLSKYVPETEPHVSNISVTADTMDSAGTAIPTIYSKYASLHVKANTIISRGLSTTTTVWWISGPMHVEAHEILAFGAAAIYSTGLQVGGSYLWVQANLIKNMASAPTSFNRAIWFHDTDSQAREWIQALQIEGWVAVETVGNGAGLAYVRAEKIFGQINQSGGSLYVDAMKISPLPHYNLGGPSPTPPPVYLNDNLIKLNGTNSWINILQIDDADLEDSQHSPAAVAVSNGTHFLRGSSLTRATRGDAIRVTGGAITVNGLAITTQSSGSADLVQTDGTLKVLGCQYSLSKTIGTITEGNPKVGILGTAAFDALTNSPEKGVCNGIIKSVDPGQGPGNYRVNFATTEPDTNYTVSIVTESRSGGGTAGSWSDKSTNGFTVKLLDVASGSFTDEDGVRVTVSRIP